MKHREDDRYAREEIVQGLADSGLEFFAKRDLIERLGVPPKRIPKTIDRMVRAGQVIRLQRDRFMLAPPADWGEPERRYVGDRYRAAAFLIEPRPYYLAYYTALEIHGLLTHPLTSVTVATTVQKEELAVGAVRFRFVTLAPHRFFGDREVEVKRGTRLNVATLERTVLDAADRPDLCGGLEEVMGAFRRGNTKLDRELLLGFAARLGRVTTMKRLGVLLEITGCPDVLLLDELERMTGRTGTYVPLVPGGRDEGGWRTRRWGVVADRSLAELAEAGTS